MTEKLQPEERASLHRVRRGAFQGAEGAAGVNTSVWERAMAFEKHTGGQGV